MAHKNQRIVVRLNEHGAVWNWTAEAFGSDRDHVWTGYTNTKWGAHWSARRALRRFRKAN